MRRRILLQSTSILPSLLGSQIFANIHDLKIVDSNVSLFQWPFRSLPLDETDLLLKKMTALGITRALAGSFEGILQRDLSVVNQKLAAECALHTELTPIGSINPTLPGWKHDLKRCVELHGMPGIRLHPNYHGYKLNDSRCIELLELSADLKMFVQIVAVFEDTRTQPENLRIPDCDLSPLVEISTGKIQVLNWRPRGVLLEKLATRSEISFDISRVDSTDGVAKLLNTIPAERLLFGTHAPFLIPEATLIRVHESNLEESQIRSILETNAKSYLKK